MFSLVKLSKLLFAIKNKKVGIKFKKTKEVYLEKWPWLIGVKSLRWLMKYGPPGIGTLGWDPLG